jgi:hypothetical protein
VFFAQDVGSLFLEQLPAGLEQDLCMRVIIYLQDVPAGQEDPERLFKALGRITKFKKGEDVFNLSQHLIGWAALQRQSKGPRSMRSSRLYRPV